MPLVWRKGVGDVGCYFAWESIGAVRVDKTESDRVCSVRDYGPVAVVPAVASPVKGVVVVVVIGIGVVFYAIDLECAILDSVETAIISLAMTTCQW